MSFHSEARVDWVPDELDLSGMCGSRISSRTSRGDSSPSFLIPFYPSIFSIRTSLRKQNCRANLYSTPNLSLPLNIPMDWGLRGGIPLYCVTHTPGVTYTPGVTCFGLPFISPGTAADDHVDRFTWCWQPAISRTCHTSFCVLSHTYLIPPETTWPCSNGESTAQTCWRVNASRGHPQPTGARGPWISAPVPSPSVDNSLCYFQWNQLPQQWSS